MIAMSKRALITSLSLGALAAPAFAQPAEPPVFAQPAEPAPPAPAEPAPAPAPAPAPPAPAPMPPTEPTPPPPEVKHDKPETTPTMVKGKTEITFYGFVQLLGMYDTTQGFNEQLQNGAIARPGTYTGNHGQTQLSARHSRFGLRLVQPVTNDIKASAQLEADFLGNQAANPPGVTENAFYQNAAFRFRHYYAKLETPWLFM